MKKLSLKKIRWCMLILSAAFICFLSAMVYIDKVYHQVPKDIYVQANTSTTVQFDLPVTAGNHQYEVSLNRPVTFIADQTGTYPLFVKLFGVFDISTVNINVVDTDYVYPGGFPVGLYLKTKGVLAVKCENVMDSIGNVCNPCESKIKGGDYIIAVDGEMISQKQEFMEKVHNSDGKNMRLTVVRGQQQLDVSVMPVLDREGQYRIGLWIKDDAQGIGTVTYIDKRNGFGALGHGIGDDITKRLLSMEKGELYRTKIVAITKGEKGNPGELVGMIDYDESQYLGTITDNTMYGVFGELQSDLAEELSLELMPVGFAHEIKKGTAYIRMYENNCFADYEIDIQAISYGDNRNLTFQVKSKELLQKTNGIVQGMSGSPIIQDGKVVGAVTHVMVNDSTKGYGIFIDNMLKQ